MLAFQNYYQERSKEIVETFPEYFECILPFEVLAFISWSTIRTLFDEPCRKAVNSDWIYLGLFFPRRAVQHVLAFSQSRSVDFHSPPKQQAPLSIVTTWTAFLHTKFQQELYISGQSSCSSFLHFHTCCRDGKEWIMSPMMEAAVMADHFDSINKLPQGVDGVPNWRCVPGYQVTALNLVIDWD